MQIDPRLVSTPIGAAIGVLIARKLLAKKDHSMKNMLIGAGLGGGAGYLTGQFIKGDPGEISTPEGYMRFLKRQKPTGRLSEEEISAVNKMFGIYGNIPSSGGWPLGRIRRNLAEEVAPEHEAASGYKARALGYEKWAQAPNISEASRKVFQDLAAKSRSQHEEMVGRRRTKQFTGGFGTSSLKNIVSGLAGK